MSILTRCKRIGCSVLAAPQICLDLVKRACSYPHVGQAAFYEDSATTMGEARYAKRTQRPEKASGRDRCCCDDRQDRDWRNPGHGESQERQDPERGCRCCCTRKIPHPRTEDGNRQEGGFRTVGVMLPFMRPRWELAERKANELATPFSSPPIPVLEIAEQNGANVIFADFGKNSEKVSGFCDFNSSRLYVNKDDSTERQSFTIAHELGHWILHRSVFLADPSKYAVLPRFSDPNKDDLCEKEANKFAACLLVPDRLIRPVRSAPIAKLASIFRVSRTMMEFRVKNLG
jgi:Zn-dependent peptidase ImmA (M78 family)